MSRWLGVDFGTCFSNAAFMLRGDMPTTVKDPIQHGYAFCSSAYVTESGDVLVGSSAENIRMQNPERYKREFKRELGQDIPITLGGRRLLPEHLVTEILRAIKGEAEQQMVEGYSVTPLTSAVITVPATYQLYKRRLMEEAGRAAGFRRVDLLEEPVAAAIYHQRLLRDHAGGAGETLLVYDLGGGTFDAALIERNTSGYKFLTPPGGLDPCGGIDFDRAIYNAFLSRCSPALRDVLDGQRRDSQALRFRLIVGDLCRDLKHQLSRVQQAEMSVPTGLVSFERFSLTRGEFNRMIEPYIGQTLQCCHDLIRQSGISAERVGGVLLVGGSCRIPYVRESLERELGLPVFPVDDPDLAVCRGAAIFGAEKTTRFSIGAPPSATAGTAFPVTITAQNAFGNTATGYVGTVHFTGSAPQAGLPADYTFTVADAGVHNFEVTLPTAGSQTVTATDRVHTSITGNTAVTINPAAPIQPAPIVPTPVGPPGENMEEEEEDDFDEEEDDDDFEDEYENTDDDFDEEEEEDELDDEIDEEIEYIDIDEDEDEDEEFDDDDEFDELEDDEEEID